MTTYKIIMTPDATDDITELSRYIAKNLNAPRTALSYVRAIRQEISKLSEMPGVIKPVDHEPWHSRGIRKILVKNFFVYYRIDEEKLVVYILNSIYARSDQLNALRNMNI